MSSVPSTATSDPRDAYFDVSDMQMGLGAKTGRSASVILVFSGLRLLITLITTGILARYVPPEDQGKVAMVLPIILVTAGLSEFGLPQAVIQSKTINHRVVSALFWINICLGVGLSLGMAALAPFATRFYDTTAVFWVMIVLSPYIMLTVTAVHYVAILRRRMEIRTAETCSFIGVILAAIIAIVAAIMGAGAWALVVQLLAAQAISLACLMIAVRWRPSSPWGADYRAARGALAFGGYLSLDRLINDIVFNLQTVIIGRTFGEIATGLYFRAQTFADMPRRRLLSPLAGAFVPSLSRLQDDLDGFRAMYIRQISRGNLIMLPIGLMICLAPDMIVLVLLGPDWMLAAPLLAWLAVRTFIGFFEVANTWVMVAIGKPKILFQTRCISAAVLLGTLIIAARFELTTFVALFMIAQAVIAFVYMPVIVVRHTPITWDTIRQAVLPDIIFWTMIAAIAVILRHWLSLAILPEGVMICGLICTAQAIRILFTPHYRHDIKRLLKR